MIDASLMHLLGPIEGINDVKLVAFFSMGVHVQSVKIMNFFQVSNKSLCLQTSETHQRVANQL